MTGFWYYETASKWDILIQTYENNKFSKQLEFHSLFDNFLSFNFYSLAGLYFPFFLFDLIDLYGLSILRLI